MRNLNYVVATQQIAKDDYNSRQLRGPTNQFCVYCTKIINKDCKMLMELNIELMTSN